MPIEWIYGLAGGLMIGGAASAFLLINGRIMGASGLLGGLLDGSGRANMAERISFIAGLILVPAIIVFLGGEGQTNATTNVAVLVAGGVLVGIGTRLANGCTSGHGVCGISRFSLRGITATIAYLLGGGLTMLVFRHFLEII